MKLCSCVGLSVLALAGASGCGGSGGNADPTDAIPRDAAFYVELDIEPDGDEAAGLQRITEALPDDADLSGLVGDALSEEGFDLSVDDDITPWLGERVGMFASRFTPDGSVGDGAVVFSTEDSDRAEKAVDDVFGSHGGSYRDTDYRERRGLVAGVVDGLAVVGTKEGFESAVDAAEEKTLADTEAYRKWRGRLPDSWTAALFMAAGRKLARSGLLTPSDAAVVRSFTTATDAAVRLREDGVMVQAGSDASDWELLSGFPIGAGTPLVGSLPLDSWLAIGLPDVAKNLGNFGAFVPRRELRKLERLLVTETGLTGKELLGWMGDAAIYANGLPHNPYAAGLVIRTKDADAAARAMDALAAAVRAGGIYRVSPLRTYNRPRRGYVITGPDLPARLEIQWSPQTVILGLGHGSVYAADQPTDPKERVLYTSLNDEPKFRAAVRDLGAGFEAASYIDVDKLLEILQATAVARDKDYAKVRPYLELFNRVVSGTRKTGPRRIEVRTLLKLR